MGDSESISVVSEGSAAVNAYGSIAGDQEATGSGATEVWSRCDDGGSLLYRSSVCIMICKGFRVFRLISGQSLLDCKGQRGM